MLEGVCSFGGMIVTGIPKYFYSAKYLSDNKYHRD
jgi:hypothetical protein